MSMELHEIETDLTAKSKELRDHHFALQALRTEITSLKSSYQLNIDSLRKELRSLRSAPASQTNFTIENVFDDYRLSKEINRQIAASQGPQQDQINALQISVDKLRADLQNMRPLQSMREEPQMKITVEDIVADSRLLAEIRNQTTAAQVSQQESIQRVQNGLYNLEAEVRSIREDPKTKTTLNDLYYIQRDLENFRKEQAQILTLQDDVGRLWSDVQSLRKDQPRIPQGELRLLQDEVQSLRQEWHDAAHQHLGVTDGWWPWSAETKVPDAICKTVGDYSRKIRSAEDELTEVRAQLGALESKMSMKRSGDPGILPGHIQDQMRTFQDDLSDLKSKNENFRKEWSTAIRQHLGVTTGYWPSDPNAPDVVCKSVGINDGRLRSAEDDLSAVRRDVKALEDKVSMKKGGDSERVQDELRTLWTEIHALRKDHPKSPQDDVEKLRKEWYAAAHEHLGVKEGGVFSSATNVPAEVCKNVSSRDGRIRNAEDGLHAVKAQQNEMRGELQALEAKMIKEMKGTNNDGASTRVQGQMITTLQNEVNVLRSKLDAQSKEWSMAVRDHLGVKEGYLYATNVPAEVCKNVNRIRSTEDELGAVKANVKIIEDKLKKKDDDNLSRRVQELTDKTRTMEEKLEKERRERLQASKDEAAARHGEDDSLRKQLNAVKTELDNLVPWRDQHRQDNEIGACVKADKEHVRRLDALEKRLAEIEAMMRSHSPEEPERTTEKSYLPSFNFSLKRPERERSQPPGKPTQQYEPERVERIHPDLTRG